MSELREHEEICAAILEPYLELVRQMFADYQPEPGVRLDRVARIRMVVDSSVHDSPRHLAACRDDGQLILIAPEATELPVEDNLIPLLAHELGHAVDHLYPGSWVPPESRRGRAIWIGDLDTRDARLWRERLWHERNDDQIEVMADAIAFEVLGRRISYCGPCMIQCFSGRRGRPVDLR